MTIGKIGRHSQDIALTSKQKIYVYLKKKQVLCKQKARICLEKL